jgi:flagellar basal-body rod protein FlgC
MDLSKSLGVSASGMAAQRVRMDTIGENLANVDSTSTPRGGPYRRKVVVLMPGELLGFANFLTGAPASHSGVRVSEVRESQDATRRVFQPGHPHASADGYVELPNVNPLTEMLDMLSATRTYEANAAAFQATKSMAARLLELLK